MFGRLLMPVVLLFAVAVAGCGDHPYIPPPSTQPIALSNQVGPATVGGGSSSTSSAADTSGLVGADPMTSEGDPLSEPSTMTGDQLAGKDAILSHADGSSEANTDRPIKNWYWLRGGISNGTVSVAVNGTQLGVYSVHVDTEISNYVNLGANEIQFTTEPTVPGQPVTCDLEVVYSQQTVGSPPVLTFTNSENSAAIPQGLPSSASIKSADPGTPLPSVNPSDPQDGSTSQTLQFFAQ